MLSTARTELLARAILDDAPPSPAEHWRTEVARLERLDRGNGADDRRERRPARFAWLRAHRQAHA